MIFWICFCLAFIPLIILYPTKVVNKKIISKRKKQNMIICCNHMSNLDAPIIDIKLKKKIYYLCKKELIDKKLVGFFVKKFGGIPVDRSKADLGAIKKTLKVLNEGKNLGIFPQATRRQETDIDVDTVKDGVAMFSLRTGVPVVPMALVRKPKIFRKNILMIGEFIYPDMERAKDKEYLIEYTAMIVNAINNLLANGRQMLEKKLKNKTAKIEQ